VTVRFGEGFTLAQRSVLAPRAAIRRWDAKSARGGQEKPPHIGRTAQINGDTEGFRPARDLVAIPLLGPPNCNKIIRWAPAAPIFLRQTRDSPPRAGRSRPIEAA
jgi:hypothetical protein